MTKTSRTTATSSKSRQSREESRETAPARKTAKAEARSPRRTEREDRPARRTEREDRSPRRTEREDRQPANKKKAEKTYEFQETPKTDEIIAMLNKFDSVSISYLMKKLGWGYESVRTTISKLKTKAGYNIENISERGTEPVYRLN